MKTITVGDLKIANNLPLVIIAGPCQMESRQHALEMATALKEMTDKLGVGLIYKTSYDKANRTSIKGARGIGLDKSLEIFQEIRSTLGCPVTTDVHSPEQCAIVAEVVDVLQIPAFLCRQTDLLAAAAKTGKVVNIKKGQFLAPWDMANIIKKMESFGNTNIMACERGVTFGYNRLVVDMRSFPIMAKTGYPVVFDATHSVQEPGGQGESTGGQREFAPILARAAVSIGVAAVFMETHQDPDHAPSDGPNMIFLKDMPEIIAQLKELDQFAKKHPVKI
jgi:2-dehydro-3-deoxyphosphooctonate aldolase (KDO 8-P synthase)